jgi:hypothetical protein
MMRVVILVTVCVATAVAFLPSPLLSKSGKKNASCQVKEFEGKLAAKRRRRRTDDTNSHDDDLPEFDVEPSSNAVSKNAESLYIDPIKATEERNAKEASMRSIKELITDRTLEKTFKFDEVVTGETLPDLSAFEIVSGAGKKKARQEARRAAAMQAEEEEGSDLLKDLPPMLKGEDGKFSPVKVRFRIISVAAALCNNQKLTLDKGCGSSNVGGNLSTSGMGSVSQLTAI